VVLSPLIAVVHNRLGMGYSALLGLALFVSSLVGHDLAKTSRRLQRRVQELGSLQAVGQALSASLDVEAVVLAIYEQVQKLMPAPSFYVALYDPDLDEVSFPLLVEDGHRAKAEARRARRGLTEYVLETKQSLLLSRDVASWIEEQGREFIGREAACWLGIPILAREDILGVIAVQSYDNPEAYDQSHMQILQAIAAQAAIAIQNARLYERTDEALAQRVQELDSVLRTTRDGILLIDLEWRMLAVNRALTDAIGVAQGDLGRHPLDALRMTGDPLIRLIRYTPEDLQADCERVISEEADVVQHVVVLEPSGRHVERTLVPVYDRDNVITGWLLVFRDLTEELELDRLREDMTEMLVHDLRSPLSMVLASLSMMPESFEARDEDRFGQLMGIARRSSDRILNLINELMDISQLERGELPLSREPTPISDLFSEIIGRYGPVAISNDIDLSVSSDGSLPLLDVDRSLITRVLANLVDNALKFTPDGGDVSLWVRRDENASSGDLLIGVRDTGPGIPTEEMSKLFEKFQQVPNIRGRRRGTGLGLPFCRLAVEAHGGEIWVESEVGQGSTFVMRLPTAEA
jgi:signal transduction histidine kinase